MILKWQLHYYAAHLVHIDQWLLPSKDCLARRIRLQSIQALVAYRPLSISLHCIRVKDIDHLNLNLAKARGFQPGVGFHP